MEWACGFPYDPGMETFNTLTPNHQVFVAEYIASNGNGTRAAWAMNPNFSNDNVAAVTANRLLRMNKIRAALNELSDKVVEAAKIDAQWLLDDLSSFVECDPLSIFDDEGNYKPFNEWDETLRRNIKKIEMGQIKVVQENPDTGESQLVFKTVPIKVEFNDTMKARDMIGKHVAVGAFRENVSVDAVVGGYQVAPDAVAEIHKKMIERDDV